MARDPARPGCALESRARDEDLIGTASRVRRWLLVEQPGPWGAQALLESRMDEVVAQTLRSHARRSAARVVLIRRPRWEAAAGRRAYLVHSDRRSAWIEQVDLDDPRQLTRLPLDRLGDDEPPGIGDPGPAAVHLVCTNGRHDPCCADLGRPVVRALQDVGVPEVWESSHVGGDRFAANVVCLPTGTYYGRVQPDDAARILAEHDEGLLDLDCYRGRSCYPPMVQAAEIFARRELGERRRDALRVVGSRRRGDDAVVVVLDHDDGPSLEVEVGREQGSPQLLTCGDGINPPWAYRLTGMRPVG
jgi:hypothetical protein